MSLFAKRLEMTYQLITSASVCSARQGNCPANEVTASSRASFLPIA